MKAAQINQYGHANEIKIQEVEKLKTTDTKVLVKVRSASLNPFDTMVREGYLKDVIPLKLPVTLGGDIAGEVVELGENAVGFSLGDKVYGQASAVAGNSGALAEFALTEAGQIAVMPASLTFEQAASLPLVGVSALQALTEHIKLQSGQKILIHGGAGGIGSIAVQIAKHLGGYVTTTVSGDGVKFAKQIGADEVIDFKSQQFEAQLRDYDAVFDTVGGESYEKSFKVLKQGGIVVSMIAQVNEELAKKHDVTAIYQQTRVSTDSLSRLRKLIEDGIVEARIGKTFSLEQTQQAFEAREAGGLIGKVVVTI